MNTPDSNDDISQYTPSWQSAGLDGATHFLRPMSQRTDFRVRAQAMFFDGVRKMASVTGLTAATAQRVVRFWQVRQGTGE